jgi:hypothetical protein
MHFPKDSWLIAAYILLALPIHAQAGRQTVIQKISFTAGDPLLLHVETSGPAAPQVQVISNPERLVIDVPDSVPGTGLRTLNLNRGEIRRVRAGLFSTAPPVTRIVVDLNEPQSYRITPVASGFTVSVDAGSRNAEEDSSDAPTVGWVSTRVSNHRASAPDPFVIKRARANSEKPVEGVRVQFAKGLLEIHTQNATLSEVLFQIQKQTGAEIAIPAGTEQQKVFGDFGPAPASDVLSQLLNGSDLNFVVVGSESDRNTLRSVILSRKTTGYYSEAPSYTPPPAASNVAVSPDSAPIGDENSAQPEPQETQQPPAEVPPS